MKKDCIDIIRILINESAEIKFAKFVSFNSYDIIQNRVDFNGELKIVLEEALDLRSKYNLPFWDCFNLCLFNKKIKNFSFLRQLKFHNEKADEILIEKEEVNSFLSDIDLEDYLTFNSKVILKNDQIKHFPLLDFHIPISIENEKISVQIIKELGLKGYLLESGKSYHFYGNELITEDELINILSYSLLFAPIIDRAWLSHQLIERSCCLRISKKYSKIPKFICEI